jgi:asparaginyl-tRNA synthetase
MKTSIKDILASTDRIGNHINIQGWVRSKRDSKAGISFIALNDGSCLNSLQLVIPNDLENYEQAQRLSSGCSLMASGQLVASQGQGQSLELLVDQFEVVGWVADPDTYPIAKKRHSFEYLRSVAHLRPRTNAIGAVTRIRSEMANAIHNYFHRGGFQWVNTPLITASDCEGAGEMFRVSTLDMQNLPFNGDGSINFNEDFFANETFLTVSGQLNVEAYCLAMSKVYTFGPTFRAENSNTSRHLAEFWMVEPEIAFADLNDDMNLAEDFLRSVIRHLLNHCQEDLTFFNQFIDKDLLSRLTLVANSHFERIDYSDAIEILQNSGQSFEYEVKWGVDLHSEHERYLAEQHVGRPTIIFNYPKDIKAFYMRLNDDERTVAAMDVLAPGIGEIIGGSQREERLDVLDMRMHKQGIAGHLDWYRDLRRYGTVPHAGFGLGFERLLNYVTGMENIRDVIPFPRVPRSAPY